MPPTTSSQLLRASGSLRSPSSVSALDAHQEGYENCCNGSPGGSTGGPRVSQWRCPRHLETGNSVGWRERGGEKGWELVQEPIPDLPCLLAFHQPSHPSSRQHMPLSHLAPLPRTHCAPVSPAHDDLGAEGEGRVSPVAVADARGQSAGVAAGIQEDVVHHGLVVVDQLGLKLGGWRRAEHSQACPCPVLVPTFPFPK